MYFFFRHLAAVLGFESGMSYLCPHTFILVFCIVPLWLYYSGFLYCPFTAILFWFSVLSIYGCIILVFCIVPLRLYHSGFLFCPFTAVLLWFSVLSLLAVLFWFSVLSLYGYINHRPLSSSSYSLTQTFFLRKRNILINKTISDGGITVDFWIIKVHTSN